MINSVTLVGRLTKDPELRATGSGLSVATFTLAVERNYKNNDGSRQADFINCVIWRKAAETFTNFTSKGSLVAVQGSIQTRSYDNKTGQRVYITEVLITEFQFLETKKENQQQSNYQQQQPAPPQQSNATGQPPFADDNSQIDISDDDLPF